LRIDESHILPSVKVQQKYSESQRLGVLAIEGDFTYSTVHSEFLVAGSLRISVVATRIWG
jgi:hypothetical protein